MRQLNAHARAPCGRRRCSGCKLICRRGYFRRGRGCGSWYRCQCGRRCGRRGKCMREKIASEVARLQAQRGPIEHTAPAVRMHQWRRWQLNMVPVRLRCLYMRSTCVSGMQARRRVRRRQQASRHASELIILELARAVARRVRAARRDVKRSGRGSIRDSTRSGGGKRRACKTASVRASRHFISDG